MLIKNNMHRKYLYILLGITILPPLVGCTTTTIEQHDAEINSLTNRLPALETRLKDKDSQIANLTKALEKEKQEKQRLLKTLNKLDKRIKNLTLALKKKKANSISSETKSKAYYYSVIRIQTALRNAGFDPGLIDGKMGERTRAKVEEFQKANGLPADGIVNKQTWTLLRQHL